MFRLQVRNRTLPSVADFDESRRNVEMRKEAIWIKTQLVKKGLDIVTHRDAGTFLILIFFQYLTANNYVCSNH